jgi:DNA-binding beta-propeller fold protein YncE
VRFLTIIALLGVLGLAASSAGGGAVRTRAADPAVDAKKKCKYVIKVIHGHKRRVRVCHTVKPPPPPPPPPKAGDVVGSVTLGTTPQTGIERVAAGDGAVWVSVADTDVMRVDPGSMKVVATISSPLLESPPNVAVGHGAVWIADALAATDTDAQRGQLREVDPVSNQVLATIPVGRTPEGIAFTPGAVWTANHRSDEIESFRGTHTFSVSRVDLSSSSETARVAVEHRPDTASDWATFCCGPQGMTAGFGSVWVGDATSKDVYRVDPATNAVVATIPAPAGSKACGDLDADATGIWVAAGCDATTIWRIDPQTNTVSKTITLSGGTGQVASGLGSLWAVIKDWLVRIDPATGTVVGRTKIPGVNSFAIGDGVIWVGQGSKLLEFRPA